MTRKVKAQINLKDPNPYGSEKVTEKHQRRYLRYFQNAAGPILEIGCGRGAMLGMLKEAGVAAYGLDSSETAVKYCREKDLTVVYEDAIQHLKGLARASLGGIFCAHVIEHLDPRSVAELLHECSRTVMPGGKLIIITPNAKDLRTTERFWLDPTHVRPYPEKLLTSLLGNEGFREVTVTEDKEPSRNIVEWIVKRLIRIWFLGYMFRGDLVVIAAR